MAHSVWFDTHSYITAAGKYTIPHGLCQSHWSMKSRSISSGYSVFKCIYRAIRMQSLGNIMQLTL